MQINILSTIVINEGCAIRFIQFSYPHPSSALLFPSWAVVLMILLKKAMSIIQTKVFQTIAGENFQGLAVAFWNKKPTHQKANNQNINSKHYATSQHKLLRVQY